MIMSCWWLCLGVFGLFPALLPGANGEVVSIAWSNFSTVQQGEWMLEFYAPWCPACQQFASTWEDFSNNVEGRINVGKVDVTAEPTLSGRFMVTQLPSVFHIYDGEVRVFSGERTLKNLMEFVEEEKWKHVDPVPFWKSPTALHMHLIGSIFWLSEKAREAQIMLEEHYKLPTYAIFIIIALVTIVFGLTLGGITVCAIECCLRCCSSEQPPPKETKPQKQQEPSKGPEPSKGIVDVDTTSKAGEGGGATPKAGEGSGSSPKAGEGGGARKRKPPKDK